MPELYRAVKALFFALDPVHVGAGGYRLGRVDMTIVREPGTNLPKVPGTSLAGAARSYAAAFCGKPLAAGQHKGLKTKEERNADVCPILYTFGTTTEDQLPRDGEKEEKVVSRAGAVSLGDARIILFPAYSRFGPVWVTTEDLLREIGVTPSGGKPDESGTVVTTLKDAKGEINIGWLLLGEAKEKAKLQGWPKETSGQELLPAIAERIVIVAPKFFSQIVNSNLEVRTSVVINPETGAAVDGGLFTYEAIPRATWLMSEVVEDDYRRRVGTPVKWDTSGVPAGTKWERPLDVVRTGIELIQHLGVGGMGTRGFGRMQLACWWEGKSA